MSDNATAERKGSPTMFDRRASKFADPDWTAAGERRAVVAPRPLRTLWFNTGTLCNITCGGCYIESSPLNDRLAYICREDVRPFLDEARRDFTSIDEVGLTGGEPFMNPEIIGIMEDALSSGFRTLVLTNAMAPMRRRRGELLALNSHYRDRLAVRVSLDHFTEEEHQRVRGRRTWTPAIKGLKWLSDNDFDLAVAARLVGDDDQRAMREGFAALFAEQGIAIDAHDPHRLVLFPNMDASVDVPEITENCWSILHKNPADVMCATSRMVIRRKGEERAAVVSCTLLPYDQHFEMGRTLAEANRPVRLNHPHCAKFCVLGGASCSA